MRLTPKNWRDFQHYKDRAPPWIRLHRKLLDNKDFHRLPVESRALAPMLWLLASESVDGVIDGTLDDLAFRLRYSEAEIKKAVAPLVERGFFTLEQDASAPLALCAQVAVPEAEAEREAEAFAEAEALQTVAGASPPTSRKRSAAPSKPPAPTNATWNAYSVAYEFLYGIEPIRNSKVNGQLAQFVGRVPGHEAPEIAAFYVGHKNAFYVAKGHAIDYLLRDAEKLRTEWATGRQVTQAQATQIDRTAANLNAFAPMIAEARAREAQEAADAERSVA